MQKIKTGEEDFFLKQNNLFIQADRHLFERVVEIRQNEITYKKQYPKNTTFKGGIETDGFVSVTAKGGIGELPLYSGLILASQIPEDFEEDFELGDFIFKGDWEFDQTMLREGLFKKGNARHNHRIITPKAEQLGYEGCLELLTGKRNNA